MQDSRHFVDMLDERKIKREWVERATTDPDRTEVRQDGTRHYIKKIPEFGNRWLRVVVDTNCDPNKRVTVFFDRRLREKK